MTRPMSLTARLVMSAVVLILLALAGAALFTDLVLDRFMHAQIDRQLDAKLAQLAAELHAAPDGTVAFDRPIDGPPFDRPGSGWYWRVSGLPAQVGSPSLGNTTLPDVNPAPPPPPPGAPLLGAPPPRPPPDAGPPPAASDLLVDGRMLHVRLRHLSVGGRAVTIAATAPQAAVDRPLREAMLSVLVALGLAALALILAIFLQVRIGLQPLAKLRGAVADVRKGRADSIPSNQPAEVQPLVEEINKLVRENAQGLARSRKHIANLAHGLKTPLASLALGLATASDPHKAELEGLVADMQSRIRHHLGRARMAALEGTSRSQTSLAPRLRDICAALEKIHADRAITCTIDCDPELKLGCEQSDLDEMLGNLVDNAFIWTSDTVCITARRSGPQITIAIDDNGRGIPEALLRQAAQAGRRLDESTRGNGFGLSIVRELAELYGGKLTLGPSHLGGLEAKVYLPAAL